MKITNTSQCDKCSCCKIDDSNKARVIVHCSKKNKDYYYGQRINCEEPEVKR